MDEVAEVVPGELSPACMRLATGATPPADMRKGSKDWLDVTPQPVAAELKSAWLPPVLLSSFPELLQLRQTFLKKITESV